MKLLVVSALVVVLSVLDKVDSSAYDKIVSHSRIRAKKEGPNVCALQQVSGTKKKYFSTCRNWYQGTICGRKAPVLYECCPGYMKLDGMRGCPAVAPIDHVYGTLDLVGARTTQRYSDSSKLREEIEGPGSYTMFAPSNEAWDLLDPNVRSALEDNVNIELYNALHYHMANKRFLTKDLRNGMKITSMYNDLELFINHYPNGVVTVNCARIIHGNQVSTNGVVHVIDRVITSVGNTIQDIIEVDPDLSSLSTAATASGLLDKLGEPGHFTLFAPTDEAFRKLDREVLERIMGNKGALQALLNFHLLDSVLCSEAIMAGASYETLEGHNIEIGCDGESLTINGVKMVLKKDIVTSNGVIHLIDQVLMPDSAKQVMELVGASQSMYGDMVSELGLVSLMRPNMEYTLLAPFNAAFSDEVMAMDQDELRVILENHILKKKLVLSQLYNGQRLETISGKWLRVFIYRTAVCIENACMVRGSKEGINGALHLLRTFIKPADSNMFQVLRSSGKFKIFLSLMEAAGLTELLQQEGDYTLFAPTDDAFKGLSQQDIALLKRDVNALRTILLYHISNGIFIGGGLEGGVTNLLKSLQGNNLRVLLSLDDTVGQCSALLPYAFESGLALSVETSISSYCRMSFPTQSRSLQNNTIQVNSIEVSDPDVMASNGAIHYVKTLIYPEDVPVGSQELQTLLRRVVRHIQIKYVPGYRYREIPLTFLKRTVTRVIQDQRPRYRDRTRNRSFRDVSGEPSITKVTRVIEGEPTITKVTRVIEGEPTITKVTRVIEGEPTITKVTRVIEGEPTFTKVTRVIEGDPAITKVTRVIQGGNRRRTRLAPPYRERTH